MEPMAAVADGMVIPGRALWIVLWYAILASARKNKCDLVVMASHGRKGLKRLLLGSETQHVLTHSHIPVLVLR